MDAHKKRKTQDEARSGSHRATRTKTPVRMSDWLQPTPANRTRYLSPPQLAPQFYDSSSEAEESTTHPQGQRTRQLPVPLGGYRSTDGSRPDHIAQGIPRFPPYPLIRDEPIQPRDPNAERTRLARGVDCSRTSRAESPSPSEIHCTQESSASLLDNEGAFHELQNPMYDVENTSQHETFNERSVFQGVAPASANYYPWYYSIYPPGQFQPLAPFNYAQSYFTPGLGQFLPWPSPAYYFPGTPPPPHFETSFKGQSSTPATTTTITPTNNDNNYLFAKRKPIDGPCGICLRRLTDDAAPTEVKGNRKKLRGINARELVWCKRQCGNNLHKKCFLLWEMQHLGMRLGVPCPFCRAPWMGGGSTPAR
ncbi:hypothetical protein AJ80_05741 [Polytolypa hystricis UAMH7299]|uniref:RING-type domain-containing protein n=1 Tax=Polytolypa hystricis (strain UAMH7299) TaxID=1447883 RepID=A0A2B7Y2E2_POLH7|nr:hypothetical protein AJ80_05741 [Polytolypa hystricis UAMH7299]